MIGTAVDIAAGAALVDGLPEAIEAPTAVFLRGSAQQVVLSPLGPTGASTWAFVEGLAMALNGSFKLRSQGDWSTVISEVRWPMSGESSTNQMCSQANMAKKVVNWVHRPREIFRRE
ncbi:hypothetical protein KPH14_012907 [Odynerus spinipes]|uniref:Uncharacterized protein n=1 Tax=Odynerus spinipes TaxID=1348599 RepID=A0AAD9VKB8_9HYME|nr:hypothetical protein KPH14_012907 [Odynerus spinipes]